MQKLKLISILFLLLLYVGCQSRKEVQTGKIDKNVNEFLEKMTLEEKIDQMSMIDISTIMRRVEPGGIFYGPYIEPNVPDEDSLQKYIVEYGIGSIFNVGPHGYTTSEWYEYLKEIQEYAMNRTRLGIPVIYGVDAMHGASLTVGATIFPQQLAMASTWNPGLVEKMAQTTAYEMRASNLTLTFGPGLDLGKHPLWSRLSETYGEDIFLAASLAKKSVDGLEGLDNNISDKNKIASCIKHFIAYGFPLTGKDRTPAWIPEHYVGNILCLPLFSTFKVARIPYC